MNYHGPGEITVDELSAYMESVGTDIPSAQLESLLQEVGADPDGDGKMTKDEFFEFVQKVP